MFSGRLMASLLFAILLLTALTVKGSTLAVGLAQNIHITYLSFLGEHFDESGTFSLASAPSASGLHLVDNFDTRLNGSIRSQGDWQTNQPGALDGAIVTDTPPGPFAGKALMSDPNGVQFRGNAYKPLDSETIAEGQTGTLFFQIYTEDLSSTYAHIGLSDLASPRLNDGGTGIVDIYTDFEAQFTLRLGVMRAKDGGITRDLTNINAASQTLYNVWLVVNNQADTYEVYVQGGVHTTPVKAEANGQSVFAFRNGQAANNLQTFLYQNSPDVQTSKSYIDNIYVDPDDENLANPVPQFVAVDTFDGLSIGDLNNRNGWSTSSADVDITNDPIDSTNLVLKIASNDARASKPLAVGIDDGTTGTLFFRMRRNGNVNSNAGLSDVANPANFWDFENQVNVQNSSTLNVRDGGAFDPVDSFLEDAWHCIWFVTNNATDTYEVYMKGGIHSTITRLDSGSQTAFTYRNGTSTGLSTFFVRHIGSTSSFYLDDIYVDTSGMNLATPTSNICELVDTSSTPLTDPIPEPITKSGLSVRLEEFVTIPASSSNIPNARINFLGHANDGSGRLFVNDLRNSLYLIQNGNVSTYLNVQAQLPDFINEPRLGTGFGFFTFHPDFVSNGKFYTVHTEAGTALTSHTPDYSALSTVVVHGIVTEWTASNPAANTFSGTRRELLRIGYSKFLHGLQQIDFNPTALPGSEDYGLLYIAVGDGEENPNFTGAPQDLSLPHGSILRIDPLGSNSPNGNYGIPSSNPFVAQAGALGEIWAYGLRNPHRFSWDMGGTNKMFIGQIGEKNIDSIYPGLAGANYGWNNREGTFLFKKNDPTVVYSLPANDAQYGYTYPVAEFDHDEGFAGLGGFVYRGSAVPELNGKYIFGDLVRGRIFYTEEADMVAEQQRATIRELTLFDTNGTEKTMRDFAGSNRADLRFGADAQNELYFLSKQNGKIWRMISNGSSGSPPATATPTPTPTLSHPPNPGGGACNGNVLTNPQFENGTDGWNYYSAGGGNLSASTPAYSGTNSAKATVNNSSSNIQLYQVGLSLQPNTQYRLSFAAYATAGRNLRVVLHEHDQDYTNYGINNQTLDLGNSWAIHAIDFTTQGFSTPVTDARLRFWMANHAQPGDVYWFDEICLTELSNLTSPPTPTLTPTPTHTPGSTPFPTPGEFYLVAPTGSISPQNPTFTWGEAANASDYTLVIYDVGLGSIAFQDTFEAASICSEGSCTVQLTISLPAGQYKWLAQAENNGVAAPWATGTAP